MWLCLGGAAWVVPPSRHHHRVAVGVVSQGRQVIARTARLLHCCLRDAAMPLSRGCLRLCRYSEHPSGSLELRNKDARRCRKAFGTSKLRLVRPFLPAQAYGSGVNKGQREHKGSFRGYPTEQVVRCSFDSDLLLSSFFA